MNFLCVKSEERDKCRWVFLGVRTEAAIALNSSLRKTGVKDKPMSRQLNGCSPRVNRNTVSKGGEGNLDYGANMIRGPSQDRDSQALGLQVIMLELDR